MSKGDSFVFVVFGVVLVACVGGASWRNCLKKRFILKVVVRELAKMERKQRTVSITESFYICCVSISCVAILFYFIECTLVPWIKLTVPRGVKGNRGVEVVVGWDDVKLVDGMKEKRRGMGLSRVLTIARR
jgi:hypothetical protein